ncbi:Serine rich repeat protein, partial [Fasciola gigantica]
RISQIFHAFCKGATTSPSPIALPTSSLRDQLFRIQLDSEKPVVHPGSPRFTSLPSPSRVTPVPGRRTSSPAWTSNAGTGTFGCIAGTSGAVGTPKKRRQNDLILYGWQVVQQAVLEVFPASVRHVPPGTRVCAAWSEQLAVDLYPGTVAHAEPKEDIQPNSVPVGFDDGDRRQVPISSIRILPDHFTNLYELVSVTSDHGGTSQNDLLPSATDLKFGLTSRHSHLDQPINGTKLARSNVRARHHSAIERPSALVSAGLNDYVPTKRVGRITSRVTTNSTMTGVVKKFEEPDSLFERMQTDSISDRKEWSNPQLTKNSTSGQLSSASHVPPQLSRSSSQKRHQSYVSSPSISTVDGCENYAQTVPNSEDVLVNEQSPSVKVSTEFPEGPSTSDIPIHQEQHQHSPPMDHEVLSDTLSTTSSTSEQQQIWHILDKHTVITPDHTSVSHMTPIVSTVAGLRNLVRRRRSRGISCRSIIRQTDGLIISIGDSVEFSSGQDEAYLGEVRAIRWDEVMNAPVVTAAWYYNMNEAGAEGELLMQFKGAVFATEHHDENEARCILRRVHVAPSYAAYQATVQTTNSVAGSKENCSLIRQVVKPDPDAGHRTVQNLSTETDPRRLDTNAKSPTDNIPSREQTKLSDGPQGDNQSTSTSCSTSGDSDEAVYFVAGKYDPVHRRVNAWDPDIARLIHPP